MNEKDGFDSQEKVISVLGLYKTVRVLYKPEGNKSKFARFVLETAAEYIPKVALYLNVSPKANVLTIQDLTDGSTARNEGSIVYIPFGFPNPDLPIPAPLLYHEIGHWWFGQEPRWVSEGVSSFLPLAMAWSGYLDLNDFEIHKIKSWWGFYNPLPNSDSPLGDKASVTENTNSDFPLYYEKSFKIQTLLFLELGNEGYREFLFSLMDPNHKTWHDYFIAPSQLVLEKRTKGVLTLLKQQKELNWEKYLAGWVLQSGYNSDTKSILIDSDGDSLVDLEELKLKTNPKEWDSDKDGLGDRAEIVLGTNPNEANPMTEISNLIQKQGIILDGLEDDWNLLKVEPIQNPNLQNQKIPILNFRYHRKGNLLYGMIKCEKPLVQIFKKERNLYFFLADSSSPKERTGFGFKVNPNDAIGWEYERTDGNLRYVWGKVGHVLEFQIDISDHPSSELKLVPLLNGMSGPSLGQWDYQKPIIIPIGP